MNAWSGVEGGDAMGPTVTSSGSPVPNTPPLKVGIDLRESGYLIAVGSRTSRFRRKYRNRLPIFIIFIVFILLLIAFIIITILYAIASHRKSLTLCRTTACLRSAANLALSMDRTADPCEDFYQYVCGNWGYHHPRPDVLPAYDWFKDKQLDVAATMRDFLNTDTPHLPKPVQQAKDMYQGCMDTETLDQRGLKPAISVLKSLGLPPFPTFINATEDFDYSSYDFNWLDTVIKIKTQIGMDVLIGFDIFSDPKNSSVYRLVMGSPETTNPFPSTHSQRKRPKSRVNFNSLLKGLKESADFIKLNERRTEKSDDDDEKRAQIHKIFYAELIKLFLIEAGGVKSPNLTEIELDQNIILTSEDYYNMNNDIYELETHNSTESNDHDYDISIPEYTVDEVQIHTDTVVINNNGTASPIWKKYLEGVFNISDVVLDYEKDRILISEPDLIYMSRMAAYVSQTPPVLLELYVWVKVVEVIAAHTTTELQILFQRAYDTGHSREMPPRSTLCVNAVDNMLGMAVSYGIADPYFSNVTKPKIIVMINQLKNALSHLIGQARWMDDNTKLATYKKIIEMKSLIGFPDWLFEEGKLEEYYKGVQIDESKYLENMINIIQVKMKKALNRFREGNNFTWAIDPTEVNAYHTFQENTITVTMVMLQPPFFDLGLDSLNYGSLGTVLGHEITHGFDNFGRLFDKNGNLLPWWSNSTIDTFINRTQCFVDQYSSFYVPELDDYVDGKKTLAENIADNGGLREAIAALRHQLEKQAPELKLPGFEDMTSEQLFFLSYGNLWCGVSTQDSLKLDLEDEHSPHRFRARGVLQNNEDFAKVWHCKPDSAMNPSKRCIMF